jgi:hypothetical protein
MTLPVFRPLGFYVLGLCAAIYWASLAYRVAQRFVAPAAIPAFVIVATVGVSFETFKLALRLRHGKPSGFAIFCFILSRFSMAYAVILIIGGIIEHYIGGSWGYLFDWLGLSLVGCMRSRLRAAPHTISLLKKIWSIRSPLTRKKTRESVASTCTPTSNKSLKPTLAGAIPSLLMITTLPQIAKLALGSAA